MTKTKTKTKTKDKIINIILTIFLIFALICLFSKILFSVCRVSGPSMEPTYHDGKMIFTNRFASIERNDVVVFYPEIKYIGEIYIKRVVAIPGDSVQIVNGILYVNDKEIIEEFENMESSGIAKDKIILKEDEYFVLGDNRNNSKDSRILGPIQEGQIIGEVLN